MSPLEFAICLLVHVRGVLFSVVCRIQNDASNDDIVFANQFRFQFPMFQNMSIIGVISIRWCSSLYIDDDIHNQKRNTEIEFVRLSPLIFEFNIVVWR